MAIFRQQKTPYDQPKLGAEQARLFLAVSGAFDPMLDALANALDVISSQCDEHIGQDTYRWMLKGDERTAALSTLKSPEELKAVIKSADAAGFKPEPSDLFGLALRRAFDTQSLAKFAAIADHKALAKEADAIRLALQFAKEVPALSDAQRKYVANISRDLAAALGLGSQDAAIEALVPSRLYGRGQAVRDIEHYIFRETSSQSSSGFDYRPMLISGPPGIGKSALLAWVMRKLRRASLATRGKDGHGEVYVVHLDFDSPLLAHANKAEITMEFYKQLSWSFRAREGNQIHTDFAERLETERRELSLMSSDNSGGRSSSEAESGGAWSNSLVTILSQWATVAGKSDRIAVFADTLEVLDHIGKGSDWLWHNWFMMVREMVPSASLVMSSRGSLNLEGSSDRGLQAVQETRLGPLPPAAAAWLFLELRQRRLRQAGLEAKSYTFMIGKLAGQVAQYDPLMLVILAGHRLELDAAGFMAELEELATDHPAAQQASINSLLYARILDRLPPQLRDIAHPGLLLPEINAELLINVILAPQQNAPNPPAKLTLAAAQELIQTLSKSTWLVRASEGGRPLQDFRHRIDIRERIIPAMLADNAKANAQTLKAAADYLEAARGQSTPELGTYEAHLTKDAARTDSLIQIIRLIGGQLPDTNVLREIAVAITRHWPNELALLPTGLRAAILGAAGQVGTLSDADIGAIPEAYGALQRELLANKRTANLKRGKKAVRSKPPEIIETVGAPGPDESLEIPVSAMSETELEAEIRAAFLTGNDANGAQHWRELVGRLAGLDRTPSQSRADWLQLEARSWDFWQSPLWLGALCAALSKETVLLDEVAALLGRAIADPKRLQEAARKGPFRPLVYLLLACTLRRGPVDELKPQIWAFCDVFGSDIWRELRSSIIDSRTFLLLAPFEIGSVAEWSRRFTTQLCALGDIKTAESFFAAFDMTDDPQVVSTLNEAPKQSLREIERRHNLTITTKSSALPEGLGLKGLRGTNPEVRAIVNEALIGKQAEAALLLQGFASTLQSFPKELLDTDQSQQAFISEIILALDRFGHLSEAIHRLKPLIASTASRPIELLSEIDRRLATGDRTGEQR